MSDDDRVDRPSDERPDGDRADYNGADGNGVGDADRASDAGRDEDPDVESMPLEDLAREVGERRQDEPEEDLGEAFEPVDVDEVDTDELWEEVLGDDPADETGSVGSTGDVSGVGEPPGTVGTAEGVGEPANGSAVDAAWATGETEHTVPKRKYCERCPHFSQPPDATCTHEGTEIVEVVTVDQFRVRNCPMVDDE